MLIVDDDPSTTGLLREIFHHEGYDVSVADRAEDAIRAARARTFDIVLSDVRMPDLDGIELLRRLRPILPDTAVVLITAFATVETAIRALDEGAFDYVQKPFAVEEVRRTVERAMERRRQRRGSALDTSPSPASGSAVGAEAPRSIIGKSPAMVELFKVVSRVAGSKASVLIEGERGTGKGIIARAVHERGPRAAHPFVAVDVGGFSEETLETELFGDANGKSVPGTLKGWPGRIVEATGGTLFLDGVDALPPSAQYRLVGVFEEQLVRATGSAEAVPVDVRWVAATEHDLAALARQGRFRENLYRELAVVTLRVPPLRERAEDVPLLAEYFLARAVAPADRPLLGFSERAAAALRAYAWPGNVRELESVIERAAAIAPGSTIEARDLPDALLVPAPVEAAGTAVPARPTLEQTVRDYVLRVLAESGGNKTAAARALDVPRRTLYRMLDRYAAQSKRGKPRPRRGTTAPSG
jgi:DNA-binding NtrC family response regulator